MNKLLILLAFAALAVGCKKSTCTSADARCRETAPTNELCAAHFERWFFNASTNSCELIAYSGCSQKGFETKTDCEKCVCGNTK